MPVDTFARTLAAGAGSAAKGGNYVLPATYNLGSLRNLRKFRGQMLAGLNYFLDISFVGDSYTQASTRYIDALTAALQTAYGDAGSGWVGFGYPSAGQASVNGNARPSIYPVTFSGTWSANYNGSGTSPDISNANSVTPGSRIMVVFPANTSAIRLLWGATTDGSSAGTARYSYDGGGSWTSFTLSGSNAGSLALSSVPGTAFTLTIEVVGTNACRFQGLYATNTASRGARINKLGGSGATAAQFASFQGTQHRTALSYLGGADSMYGIMFGPNDQGAGQTKAQFKASIEALIVSYRTQLSTRYGGKDILLIAPPENNRTNNPIAMSEYQAAMFELAVQYDCAFMNLQAFFGADPAFYASNGICPMFNADLLHPEPDTGGKLMASTIFELMAHA